jgi:membrane-bound lytic murein transglycosylase B
MGRTPRLHCSLPHAVVMACAIALAASQAHAGTALAAPPADEAASAPHPHIASGKVTPSPAAPRPAKPSKPVKPAAVSKDAAGVGGLAYGQRADVVAFGREIAAQHGLPEDATLAALAQARYLPRVAKLIMPPPSGTRKNWTAYRARFVEPQRVRAGVEFWEANAKWLAEAESRWGVPPEIVIGVIGVETLYGRHMGSFRVIDALATLAFDFPSGRSDRSGLFRDELEQLFVLAAREGREPQSVLGSYAGAIGLPQFLPSSIVRYAIDFDGDGHIDLHDSAADAIGSVAHYLAAFGWERDLPTTYDVTPPADAAERAALLAPDILPSFTARELIARGAVFGGRTPPQESPADSAHPDATAPRKYALVELENGDALPSFAAGTANFYVVTRYNWSSYYAMAVIELGEAIKRAR